MYYILSINALYIIYDIIHYARHAIPGGRWGGPWEALGLPRGSLGVPGGSRGALERSPGGPRGSLKSPQEAPGGPGGALGTDVADENVNISLILTLFSKRGVL